MRLQLQWNHGTGGDFSDVAETDDAMGVAAKAANIAVTNAFNATHPAAVQKAGAEALKLTHEWLNAQPAKGGVHQRSRRTVHTEDFFLRGKGYRIDVENLVGWNLRM